MFQRIINTFVGDPNKKVIDRLKPLVDAVADQEPELESLSDEGLRQKTAELREALSEIEDLDELEAALEEIIPAAFALVREASRRTTSMRHYDVQIMGGILLNRGEIVEMRTGEGKTLVATLPLFINALAGRGVHLVTVNEYLVRRDGGWMGQIFSLLGISVGCIGPQQFSALYDPDYVNPGAELEDDRLVHWRPCTRREAYMADVTYGTSSEFGFDYLRDNMVQSPDKLVQRDYYFAVIDEVDNVLIDEARTPLIISGPANEASEDYKRFAQYVRNLRRNTADEDDEPNGHFDIDEKARSIVLTDMGTSEIERRVPEIDVEGGDSIYDPQFYHFTYYLDNALKAQYMFKRDKDYTVVENEVVIIDDFTGRLMAGRRYSDGLHEAIEAKEGVTVKRESVTVATITIQNYFRLYDKLAGMTGTAMTDAEEFQEIYEVEVTPLPTNVTYMVDYADLGMETKKEKVEGADKFSYFRPGESKPSFFKRIDFPDQVFADEEIKDRAIVEEVKRVHTSGRPVLVGTTSVEHSEKIHNMLKKEGVPHNVLNAKMHQSEALTVAQAGQRGAVTISTNMAGRGTDILLGGNPEGLSAEKVESSLFNRQEITSLAYTLVSDGEAAAKEAAGKNSRLDPALVDAMHEVQAEFDAAAKEIEELQVLGYIAKLFQEKHQLDYNTARHMLTLVRAGQRDGAREYLIEHDIDTVLVEEAVRLIELHSRYQVALTDDRKMAGFLAEQVFDLHYKARAALIRAVLEGEPDEAEELTKTIPALPQSIITEINNIVETAKLERESVWDLGGLHVIGSERHESRRIDNQLRGRAARQGDPGSSRFFLSLEDELMRRFGGERLRSFMSGNIPDDMPIESRMLDRIIASSQERIEGYNFDIRKNVLEYDDVMARQRETIYSERREILTGDADMEERVNTAFDIVIDELIDNYVDNYIGYVQREVDRAILDFGAEATDSVNIRGVFGRLRALLPVDQLDPEEATEMSQDRLSRELMQLAHENEAEGRNLYQMLQAMSRFIPLLPAIPNLGLVISRTKSNHTQARATVQAQFTSDVRHVFDNFLADYVANEDRDEIWSKASAAIDATFSGFNVERTSQEALETQNATFRQDLRQVLQDVLLDCLSALDGDELEGALRGYVTNERQRWNDRLGDETFNEFQRTLMLSAIDREWRDYLTAADDLRREIGLESAGRQKDPKVEYKKRSYEMFADMRNNIQREIADKYFIHIQRSEEYMRRQKEAQARQEQLTRSGYQVVQTKGKNAQLRKSELTVGRNDACPCGSGKKYKNCHMKSDMQAQAGGGVIAPPKNGASPKKKTVSRSSSSGTKPKKKRKRR